MTKEWAHPLGFKISLPDTWDIKIVSNGLEAKNPFGNTVVSVKSLESAGQYYEIFYEERLSKEFPNHQFSSPITWERDGLTGKTAYGRGDINGVPVDISLSSIAKKEKYLIIIIFIPSEIADEYEDQAGDIVDSINL